MIDEAMFERKDLLSSEFRYVLGEKKKVHPNIPQLRRIGFKIRVKVDADYTANTISRRLRLTTQYANCVSIFQFSKKQNSIESSIFSSKFMAMKTYYE